MDTTTRTDPSPQLQLDAAAAPDAAAAAPAAAPTPAPEQPEAAQKPAARGGSRASTKARVNNPKPKTGKRARPKVEAEPEADDSGRVPVVLKTSRYTGRKGRAIARKTTVLVTVDRGLKLIMLDHAREATEAEKLAAAKADPIFLD